MGWRTTGLVHSTALGAGTAPSLVLQEEVVASLLLLGILGGKNRNEYTANAMLLMIVGRFWPLIGVKGTSHLFHKFTR